MMNGKLYKVIAMLLVMMLMLGTLTGCQMALKAKAFEPINSDTVLKEYKDAVSVEKLDQNFIDGLNRFSLQLFSKQRNGENILISPYSMATALAMLYNGSDHETRNEMAQMLGYDKLEGFTKDYNETANQYMNANNLFLREVMQKADSKVKINIGNSIWMSLNGEFSENMDRALLAPVRYYYDGDIFDVDFKEGKTLNNLNKWVSKKTEGMIDPFIEAFSNPEMLRLFLVNAVYFNGEWSIPFEPKDTRRDIFHGKNAERNVDMMFMNDTEFRYLNEHGIKGIEIPYGNGQIVMNV
jgi:serine protease inhibitor